MTAGLVLSRVVARDLLRIRQRWSSQESTGTPTLIYGAGEAGFRLLQELRHDPGFQLVAVVDDSRDCGIVASSAYLWSPLQRFPS